MGTISKLTSEKDWRNMDSSRFHGKHLGRESEVRHSIRDESGLNHLIMRELLGKMREPTESDGVTESFTEESAEEIPTMRDGRTRFAL